jgi:hypothetical protein
MQCLIPHPDRKTYDARAAGWSAPWWNFHIRDFQDVMISLRLECLVSPDRALDRMHDRW